MDLNPYVFSNWYVEINLCFALWLLERGVQVMTYDFEIMNNSIKNSFDRSLY
jgi:hypothetical protein